MKPEAAQRGRRTRCVLERVFDVVYAELVLDCEDSNYVETQGVEVGVTVGEVVFRETAEGGLFTCCHGFHGVTEAGTAAQFYFNEDEGVIFAHDQVDLPSACPVVALDEIVAATGQVA
jgi:hypothetical protein